MRKGAAKWGKERKTCFATLMECMIELKVTCAGN
jgi:hypothetical protein